MTKIIEHLKPFKNFHKYPGRYGIEIETESDQDYMTPSFAFWNVKNDGSLRGFGREYVLKAPLTYTQVDDALLEFDTLTKKIKFRKDSITTSVHVHINFLDETFTTMANFFTSYTLIENLLVRYCGPDRLSNLFCLPICDAEETFQSMIRVLKNVEKRNYGHIVSNRESIKYAGLNVSALSLFGSLEIRLMRGLVDYKEIKEWIDILEALMEFCRKPITPPDVMEIWKKQGVGILNTIFGKHREKLRHPEEERLLNKNFWFASKIAYCIDDWSKIEEDPENIKNRLKDVEALAKKLFKKSFEECSSMEQRIVMIESAKRTPPALKKKKTYGANLTFDNALNTSATQMWNTTNEAPVTPEEDFEVGINEDDLDD